MIVTESIVPIFALVSLGALLRRFGVTDPHFLKTSDRLVYYLFFPALLFYKIGGSSRVPEFDLPLLSAVFASIVVVFVTSLVFVKVFRMHSFHVGAFSQCCYRFNTYVGMAVVLMAMGDSAVRDFSVMIGVAIPFINLLAVSTLIWFAETAAPLKNRLWLVLQATVSNPLILACVAGMLFSFFGIPFPGFVDKTLYLLSMVTLPMALIAVGGSLRFRLQDKGIHWALWAAAFKNGWLPIVGFGFLRIFHVSEMAFQIGMLFFALPTSGAAYILSAQLGSDANLAAQTIFFSTLASIFSLSAVLWFFVL